jgi:tRNA threonylcarbamoyladenosine biosynthesis protein TsaB
MRVLGIETSGRLGGFAVVDDSRLESELISDITGRHVEKGVAMIEEVLGRAAQTVDSLDGIAVSLGPGSFTGLRVGLSTAKGICLGRGIPLVGVPTLDSMAQSIGYWDGLIVPARDARRGEIYFSIYRSEDYSVRRVTDYLAMPPDKVIEAIENMADKQPVLVTGDALVRYGDAISSGLSSRVALAPEAQWIARPGIVATIGLSLLEAGKTADIDTLEPMYVRPSEAERKAGGSVNSGTAPDKTND